MAYKPKSQRSVIRDPQKARLFDNLTNNKNIEDIQALAGLNNELSDDVATLQTDVNTLESDVDSVQSDIVNLTNQVNSIVSLTDGDKGDITVSGSGTSWAIDNGAVTDPKIFAVSAPKVIQDVNHLFVTNSEKSIWNGKQDGLVSGTNIKTINSTSLLGSGDVAVQPTLVSGTNIRTINGNSLLGSGDLTIGGGITVGTTPVTSGTDTRVFFQQGGVVQQDANFIFNNTQKRLTLRASGALSTDVPFVIRNSADTLNLLSVDGIGLATFTSPNQYTGNQSSVPLITLNQSLQSFGNSSVIFRATETSINNSFAIQIFKRSGNSETRFLVGGTGSGVNTEQSFMSVIGTNTSGGGSVSFDRPVGIGATPSARLDVRAQGALSTDIAFRVRNSADTQNSFQIDGLGQGRIKSTGFTPRFAVGYDWFGSDRNAFVFTQNIQNSRGQEWTFDAGYNGAFEGLRIFNDLTGNNQGLFTIQLNNYCFGTQMLNNDTGTTERRVLRIANGVAPTTSKADEFKFYSADIVAGNAAPHFRTENGDIIRLFRGAALTASDGTLANAVTRIAELEARLQSHGLIA